MPRVPGSGKPKGYKAQYTLNKEAAREALRQQVTRELEPMTAAQIAHAKGLSYLVARDRLSGKFEKVTQEALEAWMQHPEDMPTVMEVWQKDPSVQAFTDLVNRTLDKPADHVEVTGKDGGPLQVQWME